MPFHVSKSKQCWSWATWDHATGKSAHVRPWQEWAYFKVWIGSCRMFPSVSSSSTKQIPPHPHPLPKPKIPHKELEHDYVVQNECLADEPGCFKNLWMWKNWNSEIYEFSLRNVIFVSCFTTYNGYYMFKLEDCFEKSCDCSSLSLFPKKKRFWSTFCNTSSTVNIFFSCCVCVHLFPTVWHNKNSLISTLKKIGLCRYSKFFQSIEREREREREWDSYWLECFIFASLSGSSSSANNPSRHFQRVQPVDPSLCPLRLRQQRVRPTRLTCLMARWDFVVEL